MGVGWNDPGWFVIFKTHGRAFLPCAVGVIWDTRSCVSTPTDGVI